MARDSLIFSKKEAHPLIELIRPLNAFMSMIGVYLGYAISMSGIFFDLSIGYALLSVFFISGAGQTINDYFDAAIDAKQKKHRPIPSGRIQKKHVLIFALLLFGLGILFASFINPLTFAIASFFAVLLFLYSATMKSVKFFGNIIVALSVGFTFIFGASVHTITPLVVLVSFSPFFANWAREIIKDVEDAEQDRGNKLSLSHILNARGVNIIVGIVLFFTLATAYLPSFLAGAGFIYTLLVTFANLIFILAGRDLMEKRPEQASALMKKGMLVGLVALASLLL
ncbi:MAG: geranylgeranylglycerol-phosphate geranylgeranyltransferase [Candidatus Diapherotrites archaeon]